MQELVKIKVLRKFFHERQLCKDGDVLEVSAPLSIELISLGKAEAYTEKAKKDKGDKNAE